MDEKRPELWDLPGFHLEKRQAKGIPGRATCRCRYRKYERAHQGQGMAKSVWLDHTLRIENGGKTRLERQVGIWKTSWRASELNTHLFSKRFKRVYRSTQYIRKKFKCRKYKGWKIIEDHKQLVVHIVYVKLVVKARAKIWLSFLDARAKREMWTLLCPYEKKSVAQEKQAFAGIRAKANFSIDSHQRLNVGIRWKYLQRYPNTSNVYRTVSCNVSQCKPMAYCQSVIQ